MVNEAKVIKEVEPTLEAEIREEQLEDAKLKEIRQLIRDNKTSDLRPTRSQVDKILEGFSYVLQIDMHFICTPMWTKFYSCKKWVLQPTPLRRISP
jgi:hypothetical protein